MTILFAKDWAKYPTATIHYETKNKSFIELASKYREMGIKNHAFILALVNPDLRFVDPTDPNLSPELKLAVVAECKINPWYFFREVARAPTQGSPDPSRVMANRGNVALWWSFFNHITIFLIQPRQTGKSMSTDELMVLLLNIRCQNTKINLLTKDESLRKQNIERIKEIFGFLPSYINQRTKRDTDNTETISIGSLSNQYNTHLPQSSPKAAFKVGRGFTSPIFHSDEGPFQSNVQISLPAALPSLGAAIDIARERGTDYGIIHTTTAGNLSEKEGVFYHKMLCASAIWDERFFDAENEQELREIVTKAGHGNYRVNATFSHKQLGKTDEWLMEKLKTAEQEGTTANQDYFNIWVTGGNGNPIPPHLLRRVEKSGKDILYTEIDKQEKFIIRWYITEEEIEKRVRRGDHWTIGVDTSDAGGGDDIGFDITDDETLEVIAAANYNTVNIRSFSNYLCRVLVKYKNTTAVIERRSTGASIIDDLLYMLPAEGEDPFRRLYNSVVNDYEIDRDRYNEILVPLNRRNPEIYVKNKRAFGFATSGSGRYSRSELYSTTLQVAIKDCADVLNDKVLIGQLCGLVDKGGRIDHSDNSHDDMVISWLLTQWFLRNAKNLSFYGVDTRRAMQRVGNDIHLSPQELAIREFQKALRLEIDKVAELLANEQDEHVSKIYERTLRHLNQQVVLEEGEIRSVDEMIKRATERKRSRSRERQSSYGYNGATRGLNALEPIIQTTISDAPPKNAIFRKY